MPRGYLAAAAARPADTSISSTERAAQPVDRSLQSAAATALEKRGTMVADRAATGSNAAERRRWNDPYWTSVWPKREALTNAVSELLLARLGLQRGERVLEVGSGGGTLTVSAGSIVGESGRVVGADISEPLVAFAAQRATERGASNVTFVIADMQHDAVPGAPFDAIMSQFGVMFFDEPATAFSNILAHARSGGRLAFACWQPLAANPWHLNNAVRPFVPPPPKPAPGKSPTGPFSLADAARTTELLASVGWAEVTCVPHEVRVTVTKEAIVDKGQLSFVGVPDDHLAEANAAVDEQLAPFALPDRDFEIPLAIQIVSATRPAAG